MKFLSERHSDINSLSLSVIQVVKGNPILDKKGKQMTALA